MRSLNTIGIIDHDSGSNHSIPPWIKFYHSLGSYSSVKSADHLRKVIILSVPTRHFCSSIVATGAISNIAKEFVQDPSSKETYFNKLINLPEDTSIIRRDPNTKKIKARGKSISSNEPSDKKYFRLQTHKGTQKLAPVTNLLNMDICWDEIEIDISNDYKLPVGPKNIFGDDGTGFRSYIFDSTNADSFFKSGNETVCLLIGEVNTMTREIGQENLIASDTDVKGSFQDIIRSDKLNNDSGYKTQLLSDRVTPKTTIDEPPRLIIFDGARSFTKWRHFFNSSNMLVVLDRTDSHYQEAVLSANQDFENRKEDLNIPEFLIEEIPLGVEVMSYCLVVL